MNRNFFSAVILSLTLPVMAFAEAPAATVAPVAPSAPAAKAVLPRKAKPVMNKQVAQAPVVKKETSKEVTKETSSATSVEKTDAAAPVVKKEMSKESSSVAPVAKEAKMKPAAKVQPRKAARSIRGSNVKAAARVQAPAPAVVPVAK